MMARLPLASRRPARPLRWTSVALCCAALAVALPSRAAPAARATAPRPATEEAATAPTDAAALLRRIQASTVGRSFRGTFVVTAGTEVSSSRIVHVCDGHDQYERVELLAGPQRTVYRHNDTVQTLWPSARRAVVEPRALPGGLAAIAAAVEGSVGQFYELNSAGVDRVAGLEADVVVLRPRDGHRYARRLWAERATGMLLRADVLNERGEVIESSAFSELQIGPRKSIRPLAQRMNNLPGYEVVRLPVEEVDLDREGWVVKAPAPGFAHLRTVRRVMADAQALKGGAATLIQSLYADGLTQVSVFIEPFDASAHAGEALVARGATHAMSRRVGEWWVTAVGDVPAATLRQFAFGVERLRR